MQTYLPNQNVRTVDLGLMSIVNGIRGSIEAHGAESPEVSSTLYALNNNVWINVVNTYLNDLVQQSLAIGIPGLPFTSNMDRVLESVLCNTTKEGYIACKELVAKILHTNLSFARNVVGASTTEVWGVVHKGSDIVLCNYGDYRVIEWEREHIDASGRYE